MYGTSLRAVESNTDNHQSTRRKLEAISREVRHLIDHYPYYANVLRQVPYGAFRRITRKKCRGYSAIEPLLRNKYGLEIGGPSRIFSKNHLIPAYNICRQIDACNFSSDTIWTTPANRTKFGPTVGKQFVTEACDLKTISNGTYDFVVASHVLEHIANPLRALQDWKRVLKHEGALLVVVPYKNGTFDRRRPFTPFDHIEADFRQNTPEDDLTHLDEVFALHDLSLDPQAGSRKQFRDRCEQNPSIRAMHHHVFCPDVLIRMFSRLKMRVVNIGVERPCHIIAVAQRDEGSQEQVEVDNV